MVRFYRCSRVLADGASSSSCDARGVLFSMPKSTSGYLTSNRGKDVVGLLLGAAMFALLPVVFGVLCKILPVVFGVMCKILPVVFGVMCKILSLVIGSVVGLALGIAVVFFLVRTLSAWAQSFNTL